MNMSHIFLVTDSSAKNKIMEFYFSQQLQQQKNLRHVNFRQCYTKQCFTQVVGMHYPSGGGGGGAYCNFETNLVDDSWPSKILNMFLRII